MPICLYCLPQEFSTVVDCCAYVAPSANIKADEELIAEEANATPAKYPCALLFILGGQLQSGLCIAIISTVYGHSHRRGKHLGHVSLQHYRCISLLFMSPTWTCRSEHQLASCSVQTGTETSQTTMLQRPTVVGNRHYPPPRPYGLH